MNTLSYLLNGKRKMSVEEYFAICDALAVPVDTFEPDDIVDETQSDGDADGEVE